MKRRTCRTADDISAQLALPVLAVVPTMLTPSERQRKAAKRRLVRFVLATFVLAGAAALALILI